MATIKFLIIILYFCKLTTISSLTNFSAVYGFGDSSIETGTNNYIPTLFKALYPPYGQNYTTRLPNGRFSNAQVFSDMLVSYLGIKDTLPPFLDPTFSPNDLITGVNFASAVSGLDAVTSLTSNAIPVSKQIENFRIYLNRLKTIVGEQNATTIVNTSLIYISAATTDFIFSFYDIPTRRLTFTINGYQDFLLNRLRGYIEELYELGGRSLLVTGVPPLGCLPIQRTLFLTKINCVERQNKDSQVYNQKLQNLLSELMTSTDLPGIKLVYGDYYTRTNDVNNNPENFGFTEIAKGCCIERGSEFFPLCSTLFPPCENPNQYFFWDAIHPTLAGYMSVFDYIATYNLPRFNDP